LGAFMEDKFSEILDGVPKTWQRSCLAPYGELIDELRRRGLPYREIARLLAEKCQINVVWTTIIRFVHLRSKTRKTATVHDGEWCDKAVWTNPNDRGKLTRKLPSAQQCPSDDDVRQRIAALKARPAQPKTHADVFHYDPDEPLHLPQKPTTKGTGK
jgi:hypothetical protein